MSMSGLERTLSPGLRVFWESGALRARAPQDHRGRVNRDLKTPLSTPSPALSPPQSYAALTQLSASSYTV